MGQGTWHYHRGGGNTTRWTPGQPRRGRNTRRRRLLAPALLALVVSGLGVGWRLGGRPVATDLDPLDMGQKPVPAVRPRDDLGRLVKDQTTFGLSFFARQPRGTNLVFSPYSLSIALGMLYPGARSETAREMARALPISLPPERLGRTFNQLRMTLAGRVAPSQSPGGNERLEVSHAAWVQRGLEVDRGYVAALGAEYGAGLRALDFCGAPDKARREINDWVSEQSEGKVGELLPDGAVSSYTRLMLTDVVYFLAHWEMPFDPQNTRPGSFKRLDGSTVQVPLMSEMVPGGSAQAKAWQAAELPYLGGSLSMLVILPEEGRFAEVEAALNPAFLQKVIGALHSDLPNWHFPRFTLSSGIDAVPGLTSMGVARLFDGDLCDLGGIVDGGRMRVDCILQQATVEVDEQGTVAVAATGACGGMGGGLAGEMRVDHPFFFVIRDKPTGEILFLGRVVDPTV